MKKIIFVFVFLSILLAVFLPQELAFGQTTTPEVTEEEEQEDIETLERIKDLVASKVAELDLVERRGIFGIVKNTSTAQITLMDHRDEQRIIDIDELTEFENGDDEDYGISDIASGDALSAVGLYNKDNERLLARFVTVTTNIPLNVDGKLIAIDDEGFTLSIIDNKGRRWLIDFETSTDTILYEDGESTDSGFSKLEAEQRIIVVGFADENEDNRLSATRIIHFVTIPADNDVEKNMKEEETPTEAPENESEA